MYCSSYFSGKKNRAQRVRFAKYSHKIFSATQSRTLATRSYLEILIILSLVVIIGKKGIFYKEKLGLYIAYCKLVFE